MGRRRHKPKKRKQSYARLDVWARAMIWAFSLAGIARADIREKVDKTDGTKPSLKAIDSTLAKKRKSPDWRGEDEAKSGRPESLTKDQKKQLKKVVWDNKGKAVVTVKYCKKLLPFLRNVCKATVCKALHEIGLKWLTRRCKTRVPKKSKRRRTAYCRWLLKQKSDFLGRFAYTDGTTFYIARGPAEQEGKRYAALGKCVWRMANGKDGLFDENVGPSLYAKSQGKPIKIWGFFANGRLCYFVLPRDKTKKKYKTTNMTIERYHKLITTKFKQWRQECFGDNRRVHLVQDGEKCLWHDKNLDALAKAGCDVVDHPSGSPDLSSIEGWWRRLRQRLELTEPEEHESREAFLVRLRRTVDWMNEHLHAEALKMCTNQKQRANDVLYLRGALSKW